MSVRIAIQSADFDCSAETAWLRRHSKKIGALAVFIGTVREFGVAEGVEAIELEHYPGMTEKSLQLIVDQAQEKWPLLAASVIHRVGHLTVGDQIVWVGVACRHRGDAFAACEFIMDYLKTRAPFWKKEIRSDGEHWVEVNHKDEETAGRW